MIRRTLIVNLTAPQSPIVALDRCAGCATPFAAVDRRALHPVHLGWCFPRGRQVFALPCSCGRVSIVSDDNGDLALVTDDLILYLCRGWAFDRASRN